MLELMFTTLGECKKKKALGESLKERPFGRIPKALYKMLDWECCLAGSWVLPLTGMC